jgi:hypothetical protein
MSVNTERFRVEEQGKKSYEFEMHKGRSFDHHGVPAEKRD